MIVDRILCPFHEETTPSFVIYANGSGHCFGCSKHVSRFKPVDQEKEQKRYIEDVKSALEQINELPTREIRGLELPFTNYGYYIVWPEGNYYKFRINNTNRDVSKYRCPTGVARPEFFISGNERNSALIIVEGEINALSLKEAEIDADILSPGSAGEFYSRSMQDSLQQLGKYNNIMLIADKDKAGIIACIKLKEMLKSYNIPVIIYLMEKDCNEILVKDGKDKLKEEISKAMGL